MTKTDDIFFSLQIMKMAAGYNEEPGGYEFMEEDDTMAEENKATRLNFDERLKKIFVDVFVHFNDGMFRNIFIQAPAGKNYEQAKALADFALEFNRVNLTVF
jgi:hypothetical protein